METSFFSGSENLYKYLVTIGLLLIVLTVAYPLREKQELEILKITLENDAKTLSYKIKENNKNIAILKELINKNGNSEDNLKTLAEIDKRNQENNLSQINSEKKLSEIEIRTKYIRYYNLMFWIFFPIGIVLSIFGFIKWKNAKKNDDQKQQFEVEKLRLEVDKMRKQNNNQ